MTEQVSKMWHTDVRITKDGEKADYPVYPYG